MKSPSWEIWTNVLGPAWRSLMLVSRGEPARADLHLASAFQMTPEILRLRSCSDGWRGDDVVLSSHAPLNLDGRDQLRPGHGAREAVQRGQSQDGALSPAFRQERRADSAEARRPAVGRRGGLRGHRQGLRARTGP